MPRNAVCQSMGAKPNRVKQRNANSHRDYRGMSKDDLRQELRKRGIKGSGKKSDLVKRLEKSDKQKMADGEITMKQRKDTDTSNGGISSSLLLDSEVSSLSCHKRRIAEHHERVEIVLWKQPFTTLKYFTKELLIDIYEYGTELLTYKKVVLSLLLIVSLGVTVYHIEGPHQKYVDLLEKKLLWCAYWIGLGVLSSVGLGTGLHTFLLYLGPHIAAVTLAAYECGSLNFPQPPYPDEIICPEGEDRSIITILGIMSKVRTEAFMWGAGTALGELPPYFMAKAARMSGHDPEDDDLKQFEELLQQKKDNPEEQSYLDRAKLTVEKLVERVGFFGILACASIPNPLFDLAGITCGHFLVPFWTFFGATLIGKAIVKMHIQKLFVIIAFNEHHVQKLISHIKYIPSVGKYLQAPFQEYLAKQKANLHRKVGSPVHTESSWLAWVFEKFVIAMIVYFVLSIINSVAQNHHKRLTKYHRLSHKVAVD